MFCGKCGTKNRDEAKFCIQCGAPLKANVKEEIVNTSNEKEKNRKVGMLICALLFIVALGGMVALFSGRSVNKTVKLCINAQVEADTDKLFKLFPEEAVEYYMDKEFMGDTAERYVRLMLKEEIDEMDDYFEGKWKTSYETKEVKVSKDLIDEVQDEYANIGLKVKDVKNIDIQMTVYSGDEKLLYDSSIYLVKIGRSWYVDINSFDIIF